MKFPLATASCICLAENLNVQRVVWILDAPVPCSPSLERIPAVSESSRPGVGNQPSTPQDQVLKGRVPATNSETTAAASKRKRAMVNQTCYEVGIVFRPLRSLRMQVGIPTLWTCPGSGLLLHSGPKLQLLRQPLCHSPCRRQQGSIRSYGRKHEQILCDFTIHMAFRTFLSGYRASKRAYGMSHQYTAGAEKAACSMPCFPPLQDSP